MPANPGLASKSLEDLETMFDNARRAVATLQAEIGKRLHAETDLIARLKAKLGGKAEAPVRAKPGRKPAKAAAAPTAPKKGKQRRRSHAAPTEFSVSVGRRRSPRQLKRLAAGIVKLISDAKAKGVSGRDIRARFGVVGPTVKEFLTSHAPGFKVKTTGEKATMRYFAA
jgi:hypothetical protein